MSRTYIIQAVKQDTSKSFWQILSDHVKNCESENPK
jgi:hypothetical protein